MSLDAALDLGQRLSDNVPTVRFAIVSDIHATDAGNPITNVTKDVKEAKANSLVAAGELLCTAYGSASVVLCPGDLVHQGDTAPVGWVWDELRTTAARLGASVVGAVGNHDLLREPQGGQTPFQDLKGLRPRFPFDDRDQWNSYWAADFAVLSDETTRVVSMNTCAIHGGFDPTESEHGQFQPDSLAELADYLESVTTLPAINICMIHHHPVEWTHTGDKPRTHLQRGDLLIDLLAARPEKWIVVHGHKHHPRLTYLGGTTNGPVCLSAGSIGADVLGDTGTEVRNQMHVLDVAVDPVGSLGLGVAGEVYSYDWEPGRGWSPATAQSGLPERCGFGFRRDASELLHDLERELDTRGQRSIAWPEIIEWDPRWHFLTPGDRNAFMDGVRGIGGGVTGTMRDDELQVTLP